MLSIARAIIEPRKLILVDEPTKGLAPAIIKAMIAAFRELKQTDTTILLVEQNFRFARTLGDTVAVMDDGRIVHAGPMAALAPTTALQTAAARPVAGRAPMSETAMPPRRAATVAARAGLRLPPLLLVPRIAGRCRWSAAPDLADADRRRRSPWA